jgi:hypothetical protein
MGGVIGRYSSLLVSSCSCVSSVLSSMTVMVSSCSRPRCYQRSTITSSPRPRSCSLLSSHVQPSIQLPNTSYRRLEYTAIPFAAANAWFTITSASTPTANAVRPSQHMTKCRKKVAIGRTLSPQQHHLHRPFALPHEPSNPIPE